MASMLGKYPTRLLTENIIVISIESTKQILQNLFHANNFQSG